MIVVSLTGMMCSGKSTLIQRFDNAAKWDIKEDFYEKHGILKRGIMDWPMFTMLMPYHRRELNAAMEAAECEVFFIEHTGGKWISNTIDDINPDMRIKLVPPSLEEVIQRMRARRDRRSRAAIEQYHRADSGSGMTIDEAYNVISGVPA